MEYVKFVIINAHQRRDEESPQHSGSCNKPAKVQLRFREFRVLVHSKNVAKNNPDRVDGEAEGRQNVHVAGNLVELRNTEKCLGLIKISLPRA